MCLTKEFSNRVDYKTFECVFIQCVCIDNQKPAISFSNSSTLTIGRVYCNGGSGGIKSKSWWN